MTYTFKNDDNVNRLPPVSLHLPMQSFLSPQGGSNKQGAGWPNSSDGRRILNFHSVQQWVKYYFFYFEMFNLYFIYQLFYFMSVQYYFLMFKVLFHLFVLWVQYETPSPHSSEAMIDLWAFKATNKKSS